MRPGKAIKAFFYKVTWHKSARGTENKGGNIPRKKKRKTSLICSFSALLFARVCVCGCVASLCVCLRQHDGLVGRSLSAIAHVHLHTCLASVGMKRGLWLRLILEGHALNTTVNNEAVWVVHTKLKFRGERWQTQFECMVVLKLGVKKNCLTLLGHKAFIYKEAFWLAA